MEELFKGVKKFASKDFLEHKELFSKLADKQTPHTLFIGCSDSRLIPNMITNTLPGELFVVRNIANIVPKYRTTQEFVATTSAIEYAVVVLGIENIIICGHSNCGGCKALYLSDKEMEKIPHTKKWLELAHPVKAKVEKMLGTEIDPIKREWLTEQMNIVEQMNHLLTFPYISDLYEKGKIKIFGWYYLIETGEVYNYSKEQSVFTKI